MKRRKDKGLESMFQCRYALLRGVINISFSFSNKIFTLDYMMCERTKILAFVVALPDYMTDCLKFTFPSVPIKLNNNEGGRL